MDVPVGDNGCRDAPGRGSGRGVHCRRSGRSIWRTCRASRGFGARGGSRRGWARRGGDGGGWADGRRDWGGAAARARWWWEIGGGGLGPVLATGGKLAEARLGALGALTTFSQRQPGARARRCRRQSGAGRGRGTFGLLREAERARSRWLGHGRGESGRAAAWAASWMRLGDAVWRCGRRRDGECTMERGREGWWNAGWWSRWSRWSRRCRRCRHAGLPAAR